MSDNCQECLQACPDHNVKGCLTCHTHEGECDFSGNGCGEPIAFRLVWTQGRGEVRGFCKHHGTAPAFQFARTGATVTPMVVGL